MKILVAEDEPTNQLALGRTLSAKGHQVVCVSTGMAALLRLQREPFDALVTDWMMPEMDGLELVRRVRQSAQPQPVIIVLTAIMLQEARGHVLNCGADEFLNKPVQPGRVLTVLENCMARRDQVAPTVRAAATVRSAAPPFVAIALVGNTGAPEPLLQIFRALPPISKACFLIVVPGSSWMIENLTARLAAETKLPVQLAREGLSTAAGQVYVAPGDHHLVIDTGSLALRLTSDPPENFVRPSADPLLRSMAAAFGRHSTAVVLSGMGRDGVEGARALATAGGIVVVEDPKDAVVSTMPEAVVQQGLARHVAPVAQLPDLIRRCVQEASVGLR